MPIVSRSLTSLGPRKDLGSGFEHWRFEGLGANGRRWVYVLVGAMTRADALAILPTVWSKAEIDDLEEQMGHEFIENGGVPEDFVRHDLTLAQWRKRIARRFWRATLEEDRLFLEKAAPYIASFTAAQIANVLGISTTKAQKGLDRAIKIRDILTAGMAEVDDGAEKT